MNKVERVLSENRGGKNIRARTEIATELPDNSTERREKEQNKWFPFLMIGLLLGIVIIVALVLGGANGDGKTSLDNNINDTGVNWEKYAENTIELSGTGKRTITEAGQYRLTGELTNGYIEIISLGAVKLILDGVTITNNTGPAIYVAEAKMVTIETADGSVNKLTDTSSYSGWDEDVCGVLFSHNDMVLQGSGILIIEANYEDGIVGKDDLKINSGTYAITAKDEGIRGRDSVYIVDGRFEITAGGDAIKSNNSEEIGKGWVKIDGGEIYASADDDGIHAESSLEINGGIIQIAKSYEGLEGANITINGGDISVTSRDDGLNAAGGNDNSSPSMGRYQQSSNEYAIYINGGRLYVDAAGDGIDSNGALYLNGGIVIVDGPTGNGNGALDSETGIVYNGGSVIAFGASGMATAPGESSSKYSISVFFASTYKAETKITVKDDDGNTIIEHKSLKSFQHASFSSELFEESGTYHIYVDDEEYTSVTLFGKTTQVGQGGGMFGPGGGNRRF